MNTGERIIEAKQERANIYDGIKAIMNEFDGKEMEQTKKDELSKLETRFDALNAIIINQEKQLERDRIMGEKLNIQQPNNRQTEIMNAFREVLKGNDPNSISVYNALQQANPTQAGYLVAPEQFVSELIAGLNNNLFMRQKAKVLPPLIGAQSLGYPTRTSRMGAMVWGTEIAAPTADTTFAFGKREFKPKPATAEILVSKTLVRNAPSTDGIVRSEFEFIFGEGMETAYMIGSGANEPLGLFIASSDGITTARDIATGNTATEVKYDGLYNAKYAVKQQYQARAEWIFHRLVIVQIAKLKTTDGNYIWQPSVTLDKPDLLLGKPVNQTEYAPSTLTTGLYVGIYGDLKYYWICDSLALEIQALMELAARTNQIDYIARIETDGAPVLPEAFARIKMG
jgi:HK97 family phage major capsid protein